jgi:hypothetical protein
VRTGTIIGQTVRCEGGKKRKPILSDSQPFPAHGYDIIDDINTVDQKGPEILKIK